MNNNNIWIKLYIGIGCALNKVLWYQARNESGFWAHSDINKVHERLHSNILADFIYA